MDNQVVIVTGGARGIGFGIAQCFAAKGASLVIGDVDAGAARNAAEELAQAFSWLKAGIPLTPTSPFTRCARFGAFPMFPQKVASILPGSIPACSNAIRAASPPIWAGAYSGVLPNLIIPAPIIATSLIAWILSLVCLFLKSLNQTG